MIAVGDGLRLLSSRASQVQRQSLSVQPLPAELIELDLPGEIPPHYVLDGFADRRFERVVVDLV